MQRYEEDLHEAVTTPSGIAELPVVLRPPPKKKPFPWKVVAWCGAVSTGVLLVSICIAVTMAFLVDMTALGGGLYAAGILLSSASLGAFSASAAWSVRRK